MDFGTTAWTNPTDRDVVLDFFVAPGQFTRFRVPARGSAPIPSQFDQGVHHLRNGLIIGGLAPQLVREGQTERLHPELEAPARSPAAAKPAK
jgi:hypothetical protein